MTESKQVSRTPVFRVRKSGLLTTVQDLGRFGYRLAGVPVAGAADKFALQIGNTLLSNPDNCPALEITLTGPELEILTTVRLAVTGADLGLKVNGRNIPPWSACTVQKGDVIQFAGAPQEYNPTSMPPAFNSHFHTSDSIVDPQPQEVDCQPKRDKSMDGRTVTRWLAGCRAYLCVEGGIYGDEVFGSRSTDMSLQLGGFDGRALHAGDVIHRLAHPSETAPAASLRLQTIPRDALSYMNHPAAVRVIEGPQRRHFTESAWIRFLSSEYRVAPDSNRVGVRLEGPVLHHSHLGSDILSEPVPEGAIQVPKSGQPIALLADHRTVGGYAKIATAITVDIPKLAQLRPGDAVHFQAVSIAEAQTLLLQRLRWLRFMRRCWRR